MDLLCTPADPALLTERARYVCKANWDGGSFLSYAERMSRVGLVPTHLRDAIGAPSVTEKPYTELLYPTSRDEVQSFCQIWLFFGLLAEFLGLNELPAEERLVNHTKASAEIAALHDQSIADENGILYLKSDKALAVVPLMVTRFKAAPDLQQRVFYLRKCLDFTSGFLNSLQLPFDEGVRYSIAGLGELFASAMHTTFTIGPTKIQMPAMGHSWARGYLRAGSALETAMLENGWCISEIEKIRALYHALNTIHFLSHLKRLTPYRDHSRCSQDRCATFQLDPATYRSAHDEEVCPCEHIRIDLVSVTNILLESDSFPVIRINLGDGRLESLSMSVEDYRPGIPYVAISHVWADGLGNPIANSLPRCQVARIARLVMDLQHSVEYATTPLTGGEAYRIWIDPLCCPVEVSTKRIALSRIADVYRKATHILVLDKSISSFASKGKHPAELLLRAIGCSAWMRRLWTLQEGALAKSVYFMFSDRALNSFQLLTQLFQEGVRDARYMRIWHDVCNELSNLHGFGNRKQFGTDFTWTAPSLTSLQRSLHFRTVSVASDEPLCIATLMSLDLLYITSVEGAEERMVRVWELIARANDGVPARILFYNDDPLSLPGWRWAPRSFLSTSREESVLTIDEKTLRFSWGGGEARRLEDDQVVGIPTPAGLKVKLPGCLVRPKPLLPGLPLNPWVGLIKVVEDQINLRGTKSGTWLRAMDWYRSHKLNTWTEQEKDTYDARVKSPLCRAMDTGEYALIEDTEASGSGAKVCRLVRVIETKRGTGTGADEDAQLTVQVRGERTIMISPMNASEALVADVLRGIADQAAGYTVQEQLVIEDAASPDSKGKLGRVRDLMKSLMTEAWASRPDFVEAVRETVGPDMEEYIWAAVPKFCSHDLELVDLSGNTVWLVD
ncbi:HET domain protein [Pleurostoma richardsiae]|uniref:HET domain protein n=1 Tax=Pleurostoma richardsiae TaxID=41990 RepID=A0AA38VJ01_9PEZI|nr:HET domain protein [Pleurostoma richardsiae]